ncbi:Uncharacterised protein [Escherichia coli]|nr:Uncharacterised protein [Escherichia coli]
MNNLIHQYLVIEFFAHGLFPGLAQRGVHKGFHAVGIFQCIQPVIDYLYPGGERTVRSPDMERDGARRRNFITPGAEKHQAVTGPHARVFTDPPPVTLVKLRLMDHTAMMLTKVESTFGSVLLPFKAKRRGLIAKFQILLLPTMRAGHIKTHEMCRLVSGFFDLAGAFDFRRRAANGFWPHRPLNTLIPQQGWRALFFDIRLERGKFVIADHVHGFFTVVFGGSAAQAPETDAR